MNNTYLGHEVGIIVIYASIHAVSQTLVIGIEINTTREGMLLLGGQRDSTVSTLPVGQT